MAVPPGELIAYLDAHRTDEDERWMRRCLEAEARGDAEAALDCYRRGVHVDGAPKQAELAHLAAVGADAPTWLVGRWAARQAYERMIVDQDPRLDDAVRAVLATTHELPDDLTEMSDRAWYELGTTAVATDWLVRELALYEAGGLRDFLDLHAEPPLLARAGPLQRWPDAPLQVYRYGSLQAAVLCVTDVGTDESWDVMHLGCAAGVDPEAFVLGRLVPVDAEPGLMFERRPLALDEQTARQLAPELPDEPLGWLCVLNLAIEDGRQKHMIGRAGSTPLWSDVVLEPPTRTDDDEPAGRIRDLMDAGLQRRVAEAVATCEVALLCAEVAPDALPVAAAHAAVGLSHPAVLAAVREHSTGPDRAAGWSAVAGCLPEPLRGHCLALAAQGS